MKDSETAEQGNDAESDSESKDSNRQLLQGSVDLSKRLHPQTGPGIAARGNNLEKGTEVKNKQQEKQGAGAHHSPGTRKDKKLRQAAKEAKSAADEFV